jgi:hypothetical protein
MFFDTSDPTYAAAAFDKNLILQCCDNYDELRAARIERDIEAAIQYELKPDARGWFKRLLKFRGPATTREEALERIKEDPKEFLEISTWDRIHSRGESTARMVAKIRSMADNTNLPYVVLTDSGRFILDYKDKK